MATRSRAVAEAPSRAGVRSRALAVPAWVWLAGIVVISLAVRIALARRIVAPWIMIDEVVYSELAKSFANDGQFLVRDVPSHGYGFVYPVLLAPAWRFFDAVPEAYAAAKAINAVVMSLAAIPAYFIAKRLFRPPLALVAAVLTVAVPSMLYTGTLMTENAFYPLFLVAALALIATLEQPTPLRQVVLLALIGLAYATRAQAVALVAAAATAPLLLALFERRGWRAGLRPFATLYGILGGGALLAVLGTVARGRSPLELLGAYRAATDSDYTVGGVLHFVVYHAAELSLYLGVLPLAALLALWFSPRDVTPAARAFAAASLAIVVWLLLEVAAFASQPSVSKIEERNLFYVAPLALIALVGLAADGVVTTRRRPLAAAALVAGVLPVFVSFERFVTTSAVADTLALLPWWWVQDHWIHMDQLRWAALVAGLAAAALFFWLPRRYALVLPGLVAAYFVLTAFVAENGRARDPPGLGRQALVGHPQPARRLARPRRRPRRVDRVPAHGRRHGRGAVGERVLQPQPGARVRDRPHAAPRPAARDEREPRRRRPPSRRRRQGRARRVRARRRLDRRRGRASSRPIPSG